MRQPNIIMGPNKNDITSTGHEAKIMAFNWKDGRQEVSSWTDLFIIVSSCE